MMSRGLKFNNKIMHLECIKVAVVMLQISLTFPAENHNKNTINFTKVSR